MLRPTVCKCQKLPWLRSSKLIAFVLACQVTASFASRTNTTKKDGNMETPNQVTSEVELIHPKMSALVPDPVVNIYDLNSEKNIHEAEISHITPNQNLTAERENTKLEVNKELCKKIVNEFEKISANLEDLSKELRKGYDDIVQNKHPTHLSRTIRSSINPLGRRQQCSISKDKLTELRSAINNALANSHSMNRDINCDLTNDDTDNCEDLVLLIQCGVEHLKNGFQRAIGQTTSIDELSKWKNELFNLQNTYQSYIDSAKRSVSQEYRKKIDNLETSLQSTTQLVNNLLKDLRLKTKSLCISEIGNGKIARAIEHFKVLAITHDSEELREIIKTAYTDKELDNVKNIIDFLSDQSSLSNQCFIEGFKSLYKEMEEHGHLSSPEVLLLASTVSQISCDISTDLREKFVRVYNNVLEAWSKSIQNHNYVQIIDFFRKYLNGINSILDEIIAKAYNKDIKNTEIVLTFIRDLTYMDHSGLAFSSLFQIMEKESHLYGLPVVMLAYRIKEYMEMTNYPQINLKHKFVYVKDNLPSAVRLLIWNGDSCTVMNYWHDEYLYAANDEYNHGSERRKVFTWVPKNEINDKFRWKFVAEETGKSFSIQNRNFREYLFASTYLPKDSLRRWIFTWIPGSRVHQDGWQLEYDPGRTSFTIYNTHHNEYLYADGNLGEGYDSDRRGVYTWRVGKPQDVMERESRWRINCDAS